MNKIKTITFIAWNMNMFNAIGEKGKICFDVELTEEQRERINGIITSRGLTIEDVLIKEDSNA